MLCCEMACEIWQLFGCYAIIFNLHIIKFTADFLQSFSDDTVNILANFSRLDAENWTTTTNHLF